MEYKNWLWTVLITHITLGILVFQEIILKVILQFPDLISAMGGITAVITAQFVIITAPAWYLWKQIKKIK